MGHAAAECRPGEPRAKDSKAPAPTGRADSREEKTDENTDDDDEDEIEDDSDAGTKNVQQIRPEPTVNTAPSEAKPARSAGSTPAKNEPLVFNEPEVSAADHTVRLTVAFPTNGGASVMRVRAQLLQGGSKDLGAKVVSVGTGGKFVVFQNAASPLLLSSGDTVTMRFEEGRDSTTSVVDQSLGASTSKPGTRKYAYVATLPKSAFSVQRAWNLTFEFTLGDGQVVYVPRPSQDPSRLLAIPLVSLVSAQMVGQRNNFATSPIQSQYTSSYQAPLTAQPEAMVMNIRKVTVTDDESF